MTDNNDIEYWLPEWWDLPVPGYKTHRLLTAGGPPPVAQIAPGAHPTVQAQPNIATGFGGGGPPGSPPPAAAAAIQVTEEEMRAIKRRRRQSREKRLRR